MPMKMPANAGPSSTAISRDGLSNANAWGNCARGTSAGISACRAGWSKVAAAVVNTTDTSTCQAAMRPVSVSTASMPATTIATACDHCSSLRRSQRSAKTPPSGLNTSSATACPAPTSPVWVTEPVSW